MLYVGKAKNLKRRLSNYSQIKQLSTRNRTLVLTATQLHFEVLSSELAALLTEAELIRTYQPKFNILLKDDKSPLYIVITKETLPRVLQLRKKQLKESRGAHIFGPFSSSYQVKQVLKIARRIFRWCDDPSKQNGCFYSHIDLCMGICSGRCSAEEYQASLQQLGVFLHGKSSELIRDLSQQMQAAAKSEHFEQAAKLRDTISAIEAVTKTPYRLKPDPQPLQLSENSSTNSLAYLRRLLHLNLELPKTYPLHNIEGYDVSNTSGTNAAVSLVAFEDGEKAAKKYRLFNIRTLNTPNDFHMMKEALIRRQNHPEWGIPDLIVIDGGKGQLRSVLSIWEWPTPVIGIAKHPDRLIFPKVDRQAKRLKIEYTIVALPESHAALRLIQQIRDESHRFSRNQHRRLRTKQMFS